ncbi:MFS transporter [Nonomuraea gerenzanensis]|uniref:Permeases of the major facilitator superfamily n=1 Tax=Nonomuraea gerenzanensis TaxID=93944 RepID=A0A1M4ELK0_9ACTN|nr:MFS transporter [Nonomuraea gerenzanensis]UBU10989.1 MFS transporter [Nonomuraea gerenzanensis]SBO99443.1 Permeases of the major facilitator superfamily [Nonomuraea gerenzanensis]
MPLIAVCAAWAVFWGSWSALLPAIKGELGITAGDLGLALSAVPVGALPAMALAGRLARGRERAALATTMILFALAVAGIGAATTGWQLALALLLVGATSGALDIALNLATGRTERETGRRLFQPVHAAFPVAVIAAAPLTGLARSYGLSVATVLLIIALIVAATTLTLLALPLGRGLTEPAGGDRRRLWGAAVVLGALAACVLIIENSVEQWSVLLLEEHRGATPLLASAAPAIYMAALTAGRLLAQALPRVPLRVLYLVAGVGGGAGIALAGLGGGAAASLAGFGLTGLALGPVVPALLSRAAADDPSGTMVWGVSTISYTGFVISPLLVAGLSGWLGLPAALAALGLLGLPLLVRAAAGRRPA